MGPTANQRRVPPVTCRSLALLLSAVTLAGLAGCGSGGSGATSTGGLGARGGDGSDSPTGTYPSIILASPTRFRTFQRSSKNVGSIAISAALADNGDRRAHDIEASWNGGAYSVIAQAATSGILFTGTLTKLPPGQGTLDVRLRDHPSTHTSVTDIAVGDIFVIAGQSNAVGEGVNDQQYTGALQATCYGTDNVWHKLADPVGGAGGSAWPLVATYLAASRGVPVAFVPCAKGGTGLPVDIGDGRWSIPTNHQDPTTLYGSMVTRALATGCRAVLWWQGEADASAGVTEGTYEKALHNLAVSVDHDLHVPIVPCKLQRCSSIPASNETAINLAIGLEWKDAPYVSPGPDLSDVPTDDGLHLRSDAHLETAAARWAAAIEAALPDKH